MEAETQPLACFPSEPTAEAWQRWALECPRPGDVLEYLQVSGQIAHYPEIAALFDVPQDPEWHPEGPVHTHTAWVLDAAAEVADREALTGEMRIVHLFAALTHDFGKPSTTEPRRKRGAWRWTSYGHDRVGVPLARRFLQRLGVDERIIQQVLPLVRFHMEFRSFGDPNTGARTIRRLARHLAPATVRQLAYLIEADHSGRPPLPKGLPEVARRMVALAQECGVLDGLSPAHPAGMHSSQPATR